MSAIALVRVKRGSTWMTFAPRALRLHHPLEADRVALGHVRAHDQDAVGVLQVLLEGRGAAPAERGPQTGDGGGVSYAGLVLDLDDAQRREQLLDEVVLLVVERRPAEAARGPACGASPRAVLVAVLATSRPGSRARGRRSCPSPASSGSSSHSVPNGRRYLTWYSRRGAGDQAARWPTPFGQSRPREIGLSGSPSIWVISPVLRRRPAGRSRRRSTGRPSATTRSASTVRGVQRRAERSDCAARPSAERVAGELAEQRARSGSASRRVVPCATVSSNTFQLEMDRTSRSAPAATPAASPPGRGPGRRGSGRRRPPRPAGSPRATAALCFWANSAAG